jgi:hypothetical protein
MLGRSRYLFSEIIFPTIRKNETNNRLDRKRNFS